MTDEPQSPPPLLPEAWRLLPDVCLVATCDTRSGICQRAPVMLSDGSLHKACVDHWNGIFRVLGSQVLDGQRAPVQFLP